MKRPAQPALPEPLPANGGNGTQYLANRRLAAMRQRELQAAVAREMTAAMSHLQCHADAWSDNRPLPHALTGRAGKMVWNIALLVSGGRQPAFHAACSDMARAGRQGIPPGSERPLARLSLLSGAGSGRRVACHCTCWALAAAWTWSTTVSLAPRERTGRSSLGGRRSPDSGRRLTPATLHTRQSQCHTRRGPYSMRPC